MNEEMIKLLLVEDNLRECQEFAECVEEWDNFMIVGTTGKQSEALKILKENEIDAIILDLELKEGTGVGFLEEVNDKMDVRPFVMVTTNTQSDTILRLVRQCGGDFIYQKTNLNYAPSQILDLIQKSLQFYTPTKEQAVRTHTSEFNKQNQEKVLKRNISTKLAAMGFLATYKGTSLLRDAIYLVTQYDAAAQVQITKDIYPILAKTYRMTRNSVEKNIRTAIEHTWLNGNQEIIEKEYPFPNNASTGRPTNMSFIYHMADMLRQ